MGHLLDNCYKIAEETRYGVNEYSDGLLNGTDTSGKFSNSYIIEKINAAQRHMWNTLMLYVPEEFLVQEDISVVSSVATLPWRFGRLVQYETSEGYKIFPSTVKNTPTSGVEAQGSERIYYRKGRTLVLMKSGVTQTNSLKYYYRPRNLHYGQAEASSGASALRLQTDRAAPYDDFYNGMDVENFTSQLSGEITDYTKANYLATVTGTHSEDDWYGLVPEFPDEFHFLIAPLASILIKTSHPASQELPSKDEIDRWGYMFMEAVRGFAGNALDVTSEDIWSDFGTTGVASINIPGQGYPIF